jgi:cytochrome c oxidase assembly factor CtaG
VGVPFDPGVLVSLGVAEWLYLRALRILRRRGVDVPAGQVVCWHIAMSCWVVGLLSPLDPLGDEVLSAHMAQHLLIADIAAPFALAGVRNPMLAFYLPRRALVGLARTHWLRSAFHFLHQPLVAGPLWVLVVYTWHLSLLFEGAERHPLVHALQHMSFIGAAVLLWWPVLEPKRRRMPGELWKIPYIFGARLSTMFLAMGFLFARSPLYEGVYGAADRHGLTWRADQQTAGGFMMVLDILIMVGSLCWLFWRAAQDDVRKEERERASAAAAT